MVEFLGSLEACDSDKLLDDDVSSLVDGIELRLLNDLVAKTSRLYL